MDDVTQHSNRRLSTILRNPNHPLHSAAKAERDRRMAKREDNDLDEISIKDLTKTIAKSTGTKNIQKALKKSKDQTKMDLAALRKKLQAEKTLTPAEIKKREEIAKAMERDNPDMPMAKKMAIATATAKKVAEGLDEEKGEWKTDTGWKKPETVRKDRFGNVIKNVPRHLAKAAAKKSAEMTKEEVELDEANMSRVAKELEAYARKNGGIDKMDFMKAAMMMKKGQTAQLKKFVDDLDTEPREKILSLMQKDADRRKEYKAYQKKMRESAELDEGAKEKALKALMTKALGGKRAKPGYTSAVANNGDFVVKDGGGRVVGRLKSGSYTDPLKESVELDELSSEKHRQYQVGNEKDRERLSNKIGFYKKGQETPQQKKDIAKLKSRVKNDYLSNYKSSPYVFGKNKAKVHASDVKKPAWYKESVELDEVLDTPQAMQSYRDKNKRSKEKAASSADAKTFRGNSSIGPELNTMRKRTKGDGLVDRNAARKTRAKLMNLADIRKRAEK